MRSWGKRLTAREIDSHTLPSMLTALRLPSFHKLWQEIAVRADTEGWPVLESPSRISSRSKSTHRH